MADVEENREVWTAWDWGRAGDEWSDWWGGTDAMWNGALLPRVHSFVPTGTILEIAPGYGRWTQYLKGLCDRLIVVDLTAACIDHCRERFASSDHIEYHVNDGRSLGMVPDDSVDFVFSFDSLVHVEADVLRDYLTQLERKLRPDGVGFIHHSNLREYRLLSALTRQMPARVMGPLMSKGVLVDLSAWRAETVSADGFAAECQRAGLACISQEKINWERGIYLTDALSIFARKGSRWDSPRRVVRNPCFRLEGKRMARLYSRTATELPSTRPKAT